MKLRKRWENPRLLPQLRHEQIEWTKKEAGVFWITSAADGTNFYIPDAVRASGRDLAKKEIGRRRRAGDFVSRGLAEEAQKQGELISLADWIADTWDSAQLYSVTPAMTMKAARTGMTEFYLPSNLLPADSGVIFWQTPIGVAEHFNPSTAYEVDPETGAPSVVTFFSLYNLMMDDTNIPVVAASWQRLPDNRIYVAFYSDAESAVNALKGITDAQKRERTASLAPGMLEREQVLPLDRHVPWFTSEDPDRLVPTARGRGRDARTLELARERKFQGLPMLEQMVRTFTATLIYRHAAQENREVVHASRTTVKALQRSGAPAHISEGVVNVIKMGQPLRYKAPRRKEDAEWHWTERRVVAPYIRYRQFIPTTGETREGVFEVSGYIAGPPDAPIRNLDKVFLLGD
ncbi:hypothetical protein [Streptomyces tubercidicus]|uniref:hypothetical protein n=1 Tax=Streptomyces tubercidicus TaxID=47759 RepID=UPI0036C9AD1C